MPKSKRAKVVHLTKTQKKGKELTLRLYANVRECIPNYDYIFVFTVENMRNQYLKDVRARLSDCRLFFGKTRVMAKALSDTPFPTLNQLTTHLTGPTGLLFTSQPPTQILSFLSSYTPLSYARTGTPASRPFTLPAGMLYSRGGEIPESEDVPVQAGQEPALRKLGLPTRLVKGRVELEAEFEVCKEGEVLGAGQAGLLKAFGVEMAIFRVGVRAFWDRGTGEVTVVEDGGEGRRMEVEEEFGGLDEA